MKTAERASLAAMRHAAWSCDPSLSAELRAYHRREVVQWARYVVRCCEMAVIL